MSAWSHRAAVWLVTPIVVAALGGCSLLGGGGVVPAAEMSLGISNGTTIPVGLSVNGTTIETFEAGGGDQAIPATKLPALPWVAEVRTVAGRVLLRLTVHEGDVIETHSYGGGSSKGDGARVDLSCGRIDLWSGPPLLGPMPGPGIPGDCTP